MYSDRGSFQLLSSKMWQVVRWEDNNATSSWYKYCVHGMLVKNTVGMCVYSKEDNI
jgi:hypothetical protein